MEHLGLPAGRPGRSDCENMGRPAGRPGSVAVRHMGWPARRPGSSNVEYMGRPAERPWSSAVKYMGRPAGRPGNLVVGYGMAGQETWEFNRRFCICSFAQGLYLKRLFSICSLYLCCSSVVWICR